MSTKALPQYPDYDPALPTRDAAKYCGIHPKTLKSDLLKGKVAAILRPGGTHHRFRLSELNRYLTDQAGQAPKADAGANNVDHIDWGQ